MSDKRIYLYTDGASAGNPGKAGAGVIIKDDRDFKLKRSLYLGEKTNNQAEYFALIYGLFILRNKGKNIELNIYTDSQLVGNQVIGKYKVKNERIKPLYSCVKNLLKLFKSYKIEIVPRDKLSEVDKLAKEGAKGRDLEKFKTLIKDLKEGGFLERRAQY